MALVSYAYSDSEEENDETNDDTSVSLTTGSVKLIEKETVDENEKQTVSALFTNLPTPKYGTIQETPDIYEKDTDALPYTDKQKKQASVKIMIPAKIDDPTEDHIPSKIKRTNICSGASGLFSLLPLPKTGTVNPATKFVPNAVAKKTLQTETTKTDHSTNDSSSEDEEQGKKNGLHYFSSILENSFDQEKPVVNPVVDSARPVSEELLRDNKYFSNLYMSNSTPQEQIKDTEDTVEDDLMKDAYTELVGRSRKAKRRKNEPQEMNIIDINATDIMPDPREWMTKSLTEEQPVLSVKKGEEPSVQHKRKHQITYLAYQAKLNEHELKNQWALNKMSRKQTQAKYGF